MLVAEQVVWTSKPDRIFITCCIRIYYSQLRLILTSCYSTLECFRKMALAIVLYFVRATRASINSIAPSCLYLLLPETVHWFSTSSISDDDVQGAHWISHQSEIRATLREGRTDTDLSVPALAAREERRVLGVRLTCSTVSNLSSQTLPSRAAGHKVSCDETATP